MAGQDQSPPVQGIHSASSSDYVSPPHLEPYSPSVMVTKQGGGTLGSTSGQEVSTSGWHQTTVQLEYKDKSPPIIGLGHPTLLVPGTLLQALPPTAEVEAPTTISSHWEQFTPQLTRLFWEERQIFLPHHKRELIH